MHRAEGFECPGEGSSNDLIMTVCAKDAAGRICTELAMNA